MFKKRIFNLLLTIVLVVGIAVSPVAPNSIAVSAAPESQGTNGPDTPQDAPSHARVMQAVSAAAGETIVSFNKTSRTAKLKVENGWDMDQYLFADSSPLDFYIDMQGYRPDPTKSTKITLRVYDVDQSGASGYPECRVEVDRVFFNGAYLGNLTGANNQWSTVTFSIPAGVLSNGQNHVRIDIDVLTGSCWAVEVDWAQVEIPFNIAQVEASAFGDVAIKRGTSDDVINDPIWKTSFDSSGNISSQANPNDPIADKIEGDLFNIGAREFKYKYKIDSWPSNAKPTWQPKVKYFWEIQGMGIKGNNEQTGWEKEFKVTLPDKVGKYTLKVVLDIYQGNNFLRSETRTHTLYILLESPERFTIVSQLRIIDTSKPKTTWLDIATNWAHGTGNADEALTDIAKAEHSNPFGWQYHDVYTDPVTMIENGFGREGNCYVFRDVARILSSSLGIGTGLGDYRPGTEFLTSTEPALDGNLSANAKNKSTGINDRWSFDNHQFNTYRGKFYDPTFGQTGPNTTPGKEANVFCKVKGLASDGRLNCVARNAPPNGAFILKAGYEKGWWTSIYETYTSTTRVSTFIQETAQILNTGSFQDNPSDKGYDGNANGLFEHLQVDVGVDIVQAGNFGFAAVLTDATGNLITIGSLDPSLIRNASLATVELFSGSHIVPLYFNGNIIREYGENGPYTISIALLDESGSLLDSTTHTTSSYDITAFEGLLFEAQIATDAGVDTDTAVGYNLLRLPIEFNALTAGNVAIQAQLFAGETFIADVVQSVPLSLGRQTVNLDFPGEAIAAKGLNGPYTVYLTVSDGNYIDNLEYTTAMYLFTSFQLPIAFFTGSISDVGVDTNGNGSYESLNVSVETAALVPATYTVHGILQDSNRAFIATGETSINLGNTPIDVSLSFDGKAIYQNGVDGPYQVLMAITDSEGNDLVGLESSTSAYTFTSFEHPEAVFTKHFSDHGIDSDGDGFYNWLDINLGVEVIESGVYIIKGSLNDENGTFIAATSLEQYLNAGSNNVDLEFDGRMINIHGISGRYQLIGLELSRVSDGTTIDYVLEAYETNEYEHTKFQPSSLLLTENFQDYVRDLDGNGLYDELILDMEVVIAQSDYYYFNARLVDAFGEEIIWGSQLQYLDPGTYLISLSFDGRYIYGNQSDGPYDVKDLSIYHGSETVSVIDLYTTKSYSWQEFEPSGIVRGIVSAPGLPVPPATLFISGVDNDLVDVNGDYKLTVLENGDFIINIDADPSLAPWSIWVNGVKTGEGTSAIIPITVGSVTEVDFISTNGLNLPPLLMVPGDQKVHYRDPLSFGISATDPDDASNTLAFSTTGLPTNLTLTNNGDGTATVSGIVNAAPGTYTAEITVTDPGGLSDTKPVTIEVVYSVPTLPVLDNFNRANGAIGTNWLGNKSRYLISNNQLFLNYYSTKTDIFWKNAFGADQEAYVTFSKISATSKEQSLLLKSQSNRTWGNGVLEVQYSPRDKAIQVWTWQWPGGWVKYGDDIPVTFVNGDVFGARARADGIVEIYQNGELLGTRDITTWPHYAKNGYIGLWVSDAKATLLDDFGGGTVPAFP